MGHPTAADGAAARTAARPRRGTPDRHPPQDLAAHRPEREDVVRQPGGGDGARHAPYDRRRLVLYEDLCAGGAEPLAAAKPVLPHARQNEREGATAVDAGDGAEEHVHRRVKGTVAIAVPIQPQHHPRNAGLARLWGPIAISVFEDPVADGAR